MDVSRVGSRPDALLQESGAQRRESQAAEQVQTRTERPAPVQNQQASPPPQTRPVEPPEPPRPVVNTQGQTTGTRINTTA